MDDRKRREKMMINHEACQIQVLVIPVYAIDMSQI